MGFFEFLKKRILDQSQAPAKGVPEQAAPKPMAQDEYQKMRDCEAQWLESHYDFNSIDGVNRIPLVKGLRCPTTRGVTGQLYYYLRKKAYDHEANGNMELAVACMRKSSELAMLDCGDRIQKEELYPLIRILARNGQIEEAVAEKEFVDKYCEQQRDNLDKELFNRAISDAKGVGTDYVIMSANGAVCPECAKYQGRVYSISGKSKKFPKLPEFFFETGRVHPGCTHTFSPYIDGVTDPMLEYTLDVHPLKNKLYGRNIVVFSNRPFSDDRTEAVKVEANAYLSKVEAQNTLDKRNEDCMIESEAKRGQEARDFRWLQENCPEKCPKSVTGFRRMKTQNTRNYQALKQFAAEHGREI